MLNLEVFKQGFLYNSMHRYWYQADLQLITNILPISPISNNISQLYVGAITYPGPRFFILNQPSGPQLSIGLSNLFDDILAVLHNVSLETIKMVKSNT